VLQHAQLKKQFDALEPALLLLLFLLQNLVEKSSKCAVWKNQATGEARQTTSHSAPKNTLQRKAGQSTRGKQQNGRIAILMLATIMEVACFGIG
jgi:hypothetical protein